MKLKLGVDHSTSTIRRYMVDGAPPTGSTWRRFLASHAKEILAIDFAAQPLWDFSVQYVLVILALDTRRVVHCAVTASPTLAWVKQQLQEAKDAWSLDPYSAGWPTTTSWPRSSDRSPEMHHTSSPGAEVRDGSPSPRRPPARGRAPSTSRPHRSLLRRPRSEFEEAAHGPPAAGWGFDGGRA